MRLLSWKRSANRRSEAGDQDDVQGARSGSRSSSDPGLSDISASFAPDMQSGRIISKFKTDVLNQLIGLLFDFEQPFLVKKLDDGHSSFDVWCNLITRPSDTAFSPSACPASLCHFHDGGSLSNFGTQIGR